MMRWWTTGDVTAPGALERGGPSHSIHRKRHGGRRGGRKEKWGERNTRTQTGAVPLNHLLFSTFTLRLKAEQEQLLPHRGWWDTFLPILIHIFCAFSLANPAPPHPYPPRSLPYWMLRPQALLSGNISITNMIPLPTYWKFKGALHMQYVTLVVMSEVLP